MSHWTPEIERRLSGLAIDPARAMEIIEELSLHLDARLTEFRRQGMSDADARAAALAELDDEDLLRGRLAPLRLSRAPEPIAAGAPRGRVFGDIWRDVRLAVRMLRARPGFTIVAVLTLALGLGANTAIFSIVHAVLLRPLPFGEPDRLVFVWSTSPDRPLENLTPGRLVDFMQRAQSLESVAGISHIPLNLTGRAVPERLSASSVSSSFFDVLGVKPLHGRTFDRAAGQNREVVLSHALWTRLFNADPAVVGTSIPLNAQPHTVVGVMPSTFVWPTVAINPVAGPGPEIWVAARRHEIPDMPVDRGDDLRLNRRTGYLRAVARLKAGQTIESANAEAAAIAAALEREHPQSDQRRGARVVPVRDHLLGDSARPLLLIGSAVTFVLLIACANVANLLMARAASRRREFEVRLALGASRGRLVRQMLVESAVLSIVGAALGAVVARWSLGALIAAVPAGLLRIEEASLSLPVLAFSFAAALITSALFGLLPALQAARLAGKAGLRDDSRTVGRAGRARVRTLIAGAEIAIAVALVVGASLLVRSFVTLQRVDVGLDIDRLLTFDVALSGERAQYQSQQVAFYERVLERLRAIPGVTAAGMAVTLPIGGDDFGAPVTFEGRPLPPQGQEANAGFQMVSPGYFAAAGMALIAGRDVAITDTRDRTPVAVINKSFAAAHWPGEYAIGRRFRIGGDPTDPFIEVVGIVDDIHHYGPARPARAEFYLPYSQSSFSFMSVLVRTDGDPGALSPAVRRAVAEVDPQQPVAKLTTMEAHMRDALAQPRFLSAVTLLFGGLALTLAAIGIYGVMAWSVTARAQEFGVRLALGARPSRLLRQVLGEGMLVVAAGALAGLAVAAALSSLIASFLFETAPRDPAAYVVALVVVFAVSLAALIVPAVRAMRVDPMRVLRQ